MDCHLLLLVMLVFIKYTFCERGKCSAGKFGWKCKFVCACKRGSCDQATGYCDTRCRAGRYGKGCLLDSKCLYDSKGVNYTGNVSVTKDGKKCIRWMADFVQGRGDTKDRFPPEDRPERYCRNPRMENGNYAPRPWCFHTTKGDRPYAECDIETCECPDGLFGPSCPQVCHCRDVDEGCQKVVGTCKSGCADGWIGVNCQRSCESGTFGRDCKEMCDNCYENQCDPEYGDCQNGCIAGYRGLDCSMECPKGRHGRNCVEPCGVCRDSETCNAKTGICFRGCADGYEGHYCIDKCPEGRYGSKCRHYCGYCKQGTTCDHVTGKCLRGCAAGRTGDKCIESCPEKKYGENCTFVCGKYRDGAPCLPTTGQCLDGCTDDYLGHGCAQKAPSNGNIIGGVIAAVSIFLFVIVVMILVCYYYRKKRNTSKPSLGQEMNIADRHRPQDPAKDSNVYCKMLEDKSDGGYKSVIQ